MWINHLNKLAQRLKEEHFKSNITTTLKRDKDVKYDMKYTTCEEELKKKNKVFYNGFELNHCFKTS